MWEPGTLRNTWKERQGNTISLVVRTTCNWDESVRKERAQRTVGSTEEFGNLRSKASRWRAGGQESYERVRNWEQSNHKTTFLLGEPGIDRTRWGFPMELGKKQRSQDSLSPKWDISGYGMLFRPPDVYPYNPQLSIFLIIAKEFLCNQITWPKTLLPSCKL